MEFNAIYNGSSYQVYVEGLRSDGNEITMKFDTGASNTVISLRVLTDNDDAERIIRQYCSRQHIGIKTFYSATGHPMEGIPIKVANVSISGNQWRVFYYHLILNVKNNVALLGDDFISSCEFRHTRKGSIIVSDFYSEDYEDLWKNYVLQDKIYEILSISG